MPSILIKNARIVNENKIFFSDILIRNSRIERIDSEISVPEKHKIIDAENYYVLPGLIDDQVHFREPGLTYKADISSESRAAVAGGVTSYMEMPNTIPNATNIEKLEKKYLLAKNKSLANYSFFMGTTNNNSNEVLKIDKQNICGIKIFMGSSTGNMLVDSESALRNIFKNSEILIATHCEDENTIRDNLKKAKKLFGKKIPIQQHPIIRSHEACYLSSSKAIQLAKEYDTRLHILHISTADEINLFSNKLPINQKKITSEACIHHLYFDERDYEKLGTKIKWNPAIKSEVDKKSILKALLDDKIDVVATDHAPHTIEEKSLDYEDCPSGGPLIQFALPTLIEMHLDKKISLEKIVEKSSHNPAIIFNIKDRGFIREGYFADIAIINLNRTWRLRKNDILSKCKWSPFTNKIFRSKIEHTLVSGHHVFDKGVLHEREKGMRLKFDRV